MASGNDGLTLQDLLLTEAVKDFETHTPLRDDDALIEALSAAADRSSRLVARARRLAADTGLAADAARLRDGMVTLGIVVAGGVFLLAGLVTLALLGEGRRINAVAAMALLVAPNLLGILAWLAYAALGARAGAGLAGRAVAALARSRWAGAHVRRIWPAAARVLDAQGLTAWALGGLNHLVWTLVYTLAAFAVAAVFSFSRYQLAWETTILSPQALQEIARVIAWLPRHIGLPAPVPETLDDPQASQMLGVWLIAGTLAYGALPRVLLALLCGAVLAARRRRLTLDIDDPYHRRVLARLEALAPTRVIDDEHAAPASPRERAEGRFEAGTLALVGFELPPEVALPAALLARAAWSERLDGGIAERQAVLRRLAEHPPARLLLACHAPSTPDRGTLRFLESARAGGIALLLLGDGAHAARWRDWLDAAGRADIAVLTDADEALAAHG